MARGPLIAVKVATDATDGVKLSPPILDSPRSLSTPDDKLGVKLSASRPSLCILPRASWAEQVRGGGRELENFHLLS